MAIDCSRPLIKKVLLATLACVGAMGPSVSADRGDTHAAALSHRYGAYTKAGNIAAGQTVVIETPEGSITCTGGDNRDYTGKNGPEGSLKPKPAGRACHFN
jgi:hypothetical protein